MSKVCEYQGYYIDYDEETGEEDVLKCMLFTNEGVWDEYCYCDEEERNNCMLYKYSKYIEEKDEEIERLTKVEKEHQRINGELREELKILKEIQKIEREREYHSKFLKDFQKERGNNVSPDHDEIYKRYDDYKNRVEKAIKYIEEELWEVGGQVNGSDLPYDKAIQPLLDILKGSDKHEQ